MESSEIPTECSRKPRSPAVPAVPCQTEVYSEKVGEKTNFGVGVLAVGSVLNPVSTIQSTGKKNTTTMNQVSMPSPSRTRGLVCRSASVRGVFIVPSFLHR